MPRPNDNYAPTCPICCFTMRRNGKVRTRIHSVGNFKIQFISKQRWRCSKCNYSETANHEAHNANVRTGYGIDKLSKVAVPYKPLTKYINSEPTQVGEQLYAERALFRTDSLEQTTSRVSSDNQALASEQISEHL